MTDEPHRWGRHLLARELVAIDDPDATVIFAGMVSLMVTQRPLPVSRPSQGCNLRAALSGWLVPGFDPLRE
jgi:hypothetical protein